MWYCEEPGVDVASEVVVALKEEPVHPKNDCIRRDAPMRGAVCRWAISGDDQGPADQIGERDDLMVTWLLARSDAAHRRMTFPRLPCGHVPPPHCSPLPDQVN